MRLNSEGVSWFLLGGMLLSFFLVAADLLFDVVGFSFLVVTLQSLFVVFLFGRRVISLLRIYFVFSFLFLSLIPWVQYTKGAVLWGGGGFRDDDYLIANALVFASNFLVCYVYRLTEVLRGTVPSKVQSLNQRDCRSPKRPFFQSAVLICLSCVSFLGLFYLNDFSLARLMFRGLLDDQIVQSSENSSLVLLFGMTTRLIPFFSFLFAYCSEHISRNVKIFLFLLLVMCVFPTGVARFMVGFVYVPILLLMSKKMRDGYVFSVFLIGALVFVFPFLNQFRYFEGVEHLRFMPDAEFFLQGHFDAYQNLMRVVQIEFVTHGVQLLGALLFFVPRAFWPSKPVGSGFELSERLGYEFNNISMPFIGEGYVNFGVLGIFLFAGAIAFFMAVLDGRYACELRKSARLSYSASIYLYLCGALVFVLRGDMLSSFAYVMAGVFSAYFVRFAACLGRSSGYSRR